MRILFLSNFYPPYDVGGYEQWCQEVALGLRARGHEIAVLTSTYGMEDRDAGRRALTPEGTEVFRLLSLDCDIQHYDPLAFFTKRRRRERVNLRYLQAVVRDFRPEILFVWGMWNLSRKLPAYAETHGPPVVYFLSDHWPAEPDAHVRYWRRPAAGWGGMIKRFGSVIVSAIRRLEGMPQLRFDRAMCVSRAIKDGLLSAGLPLETAAVVHGGIDPQPFSAAVSSSRQEQRGIVRLLYAGGLGAHKGVHTAIEALGLVVAVCPDKDLRLTVVGSGHPEYEAYLEDLVKEHGVTDQVEFQGRVPHDEMVAIYRNHDVLLFPSVWEEPFARVPLEAMASGLAVVATPTGGTSEIVVHGENGLTFHPEDPEDLAAQIEHLVRFPEDACRIAQNGRRIVREYYTLDRMVSDIESFLLATV
jgi:glycosyltransferase involved in cell wall biosynthesis